MLTQEFDLKIIPDSGPVVVHVNQYDTGIGRFVIHLLDVDETPYSPTNAVVMIQGTKPDKHGFAYTATISGSTVTADVTEQMTAVEGIVRTQIIVTDAQGVTGTFVFHMDVQRSALQDDTDISETELPAIIDLARKNAREAAESAAAAKVSEDNAKDSEDAAAESEANAATSETNAAQSESNAATSEENAEAWAVGTRDGNPVSSTDETYHNNSKYYSDRALISETNAAASEANAAASEANAATSETNASASAANAAESETNAKTSETNSADSASAAAESEVNAKVSETNAAVSESNAATSESYAESWAVGQRAGVDVPDTDATYQNNSKYYSRLAGTHASNAESSKMAAKASEDAAKASEEILEYYVHYVIPRFIIQNNRLYINDLAQGEFIVANNRLYIRNPD